MPCHLLAKCLRGRKVVRTEQSKLREKFLSIYGENCQNLDSGKNSSGAAIQELDLSSNFFNGTLPNSLLENLAAAAAVGGSLVSLNVSNNSFIGNHTAEGKMNLPARNRKLIGSNEHPRRRECSAVEIDDRKLAFLSGQQETAWRRSVDGVKALTSVHGVEALRHVRFR
ncbi:uncharacterized protein HKW66_Vig0177570 [Vigna angularis]|uniref:Uncharacterized protein n=1 Tax=Phaseolus angularis TaxID=3914 RepID=A0A8T0JXS5_PHAAN|nr:uncharacterized protein HKW66_Vig0177570 [Vigna angularis]